MPYPYANKPDLRSRASMTAFLKNHFRYWTMNSWNRSTSYANNVKLHELSLPPETYDLALDLTSGEILCQEWSDAAFYIMDRFEHDTGFVASFNGRSHGYLVMYQTGTDPKTGNHVVWPGRSVDQDEDFEDWSIADLRDRVRVVHRLDQMCDELRDALVHVLTTYKLDTEVVTSVREVKVLYPPTE